MHALNISYHVICGTPTLSDIADNVSASFGKNSIQVSGLLSVSDDANRVLIYFASKLMLETVIRWCRYTRCESNRKPPFHDHGQPTEGRPRAPEYRPAADGPPGGSFSPYHSAHGSKRRSYPRQRRFSDEIGFCAGECRDRVDQSGRAEFGRWSRRSSQGARHEAQNEEHKATQTFVVADPGTGAMNRRGVGKMDFPIEDDENAEDKCTR